MSKSKIVALAALLAAASAVAATKRWTHGTIVAANEIVGTRSGISFGLGQPPPGDLPQLFVGVVPSGGLIETVNVFAFPPGPSVPPDPCFEVTVTPPDPDRPAAITVQILHPEQISLFFPDGTPAQLCSVTPADIGPSGATADIAPATDSWSPGSLAAANEIVGARSGLSFGFPPGPPDRPVLTVSAVFSPGLVEALSFGFVAPPDPDSNGLPPDPCFQVRLQPPPDPDKPGQVDLQFLNPDAVTILGPNGGPSALCTATIIQPPG